MPKRTWLVLALGWTVMMAIVCLVSFNEFPSVKVENADKFVHVTLHFVFVTLWCQHFKNNTSVRARQLWKALAFSVIYGCLIEIAQECFTATRQADFADVAANFAGAALAILVQLAIAALTKRHKV